MDWDIRNSVVTSLLDVSVQSVVKNIKSYWSCLDVLPSNLRDRCLHLMSKRGLLTDINIRKVLHDKLMVLDLSESSISDVGLQHINKCPQLRKLDLNATKGCRPEITTEGIKCVANSCHYLHTVYLRRCTSITDEAVICLAEHCPQLQALNLGGCHQLTDRSLKALGEHCQLLKCIIFSKTKSFEVINQLLQICRLKFYFSVADPHHTLQLPL
ncbi:hypothetical protein ScPMuIL_013289 [Solemya velum]